MQEASVKREYASQAFPDPGATLGYLSLAPMHHGERKIFLLVDEFHCVPWNFYSFIFVRDKIF